MSKDDWPEGTEAGALYEKALRRGWINPAPVAAADQDKYNEELLKHNLTHAHPYAKANRRCTYCKRIRLDRALDASRKRIFR
jgi:hypothetical protein